MDIEHRDITAGEIHAPYNWIVANQAARLAISPASGDQYKTCLQQSDGTVWWLDSVTPIAWSQDTPKPHTHDYEQSGAAAAAVTAHVQASDPHAQYLKESDAETALSNKVDKVTGKQLSTEDYTTADKDKLSGIEAGANAYTHPDSHPASMISEDSTHRFTTDAEKSKLSGIEAGANAYTHPLNHPASMITDDGTHRFATDAEKATWNGKADLVSGKVPASQLPSYVDDVIEVSTYSALPATGETGKIYIALDTNIQYRWGGSSYIQLVSSPGSTDSVAEGTTNLYFTVARVRDAVLTGLSTATSAVISATDTVLSAFGKLQKQISDNLTTLTTHTGNTSNPHGTTASQVDAMATSHAANAITGFGTSGTATSVARSDHTHGASTLSGVVKSVNGASPDANGAVTISAQAQAQAPGLVKADAFSPAFVKTGAGTVSVKAGTSVVVAGTAVSFSTQTAITMPTLTAGTDYAIYVCTDGSIRADSSWSYPTGYTTSNSLKIGGFHYAPGGNAAAQDGGDTTPAINAYSFWDLKFRPACPDPRGMTLVADSFWSDIYLLGVDHLTNGTSKYNVSIADGSAPPKIPTKFGGTGSNTYSTMDWWEANEVLQSWGKRSPTYDEFSALAYGTTEATASGGGDVPTTGVSGTGATNAWNKFTSRWGVIQSTGCMWIRGGEFGGGAGAGWTANTGGRGSTYQMENAILLGGCWGDQTESGSRCSVWNNSPTASNCSLGARGVCSHMVIA